MAKKFTLTDETIIANDGTTLNRINYSCGRLGGWLAKEGNLSQDGNAWVEDAQVFGDVQVSNVRVNGNAWAFVNAWAEDAQVSGNVWVNGNVWVFGNAWDIKE